LPPLQLVETEHDRHDHSHGLIDRSILRSRAGIRAVSWSLAILTVNALAQTLERMVSSPGGAGGRHRSGVRMPAPDRSTPASPCCFERDGKYGAGACGIADCCLEREP
jgi:hypothetical protein